MKISNNLRTLSFFLSIILITGSSLPALAFLTSRENSPPGTTRTEIAQGRRRLFSFKRRNLVARGSRTIGARRGSCLAPGKKVTALVPPDLKKDANGNLVLDLDKYGELQYRKNLWYTASAFPTVFFHVPELNPEETEFSYEAELVVKDQNNQPIYTKMVKLPQRSGVISLTFPDNDPQFSGLEIGKTYQWDITVVCDAGDWQANPKVGGWMYRVDANTPLLPQFEASSGNADQVNLDELDEDYILNEHLQQASPDAYPSVYAQANIWYDTLTSLALLRQQHPEDVTLQEDWQNLLSSVGYQAHREADLFEIATEPLVGAATVIQSE